MKAEGFYAEGRRLLCKRKEESKKLLTNDK